MPSSPPPHEVLQAFGLREEPQRLAGGQGQSWRCGEEDPATFALL
ncbi:hypothetical protein [Phycicoccus avicenniae]